MANIITVKTDINASIQKVWEYWTNPKHIMQWNHASDDWHCPNATNDLWVGGNFVYTMAAKDASVSFDFNGVYHDLINEELIMYTMEDGRKVKITFASIGDVTEVAETFEPENENSLEMQQQGWQSILNNFKFYVESFL